MYSIPVKGNSRCNGLVPPLQGGMVKQNVHGSAMPPHRLSPSSDARLKFSDRVKSYLNPDSNHSKFLDHEDPYAFSDSDVRVKPFNNLVKKCTETKTKVNNVKGRAIAHPDGPNARKPEPKHHTILSKNVNRLHMQLARNKLNFKRVKEVPEIKVESVEENEKKHSIIGLVEAPERRSSVSSNKVSSAGKPIPTNVKARRVSAKSTHHEALQRIRKTPHWHAPTSSDPYPNCSGVPESSDDDNPEYNPLYQNHWFCARLEMLAVDNCARQDRLEIKFEELDEQVVQVLRRKRAHSPPDEYVHRLAAVSKKSPVAFAKALKQLAPPQNRPEVKVTGLLPKQMCNVNGCKRQALPCTRFCTQHIMRNTDQVLFEHCTAKFADNTQCSVPVFDIMHELPLCTEHARKRDNYNRMCQETKPKKQRRKVKPAMIRPQKRSKKRKRSSKSSSTSSHSQSVLHANAKEISELNICETSSAYESSEELGIGGLSESEFVTIKEDNLGEQDVVEQVLAMQDEVSPEDIPLELVTVEQALVSQASRLLEETDFTTVLNQIPPDAFNDFFAVDRNGEYEPTREETEELERALEAVDEDVKSLEKLSQTQGLLDTLLDEHTLVESLVQIPDVFQNGYSSPCSSGTSSQPARPLATVHQGLHVEGLLPIQPQAHAPT